MHGISIVNAFVLTFINVELFRVQLLKAIFTNIIDRARSIRCFALYRFNILDRWLLFARSALWLLQIRHDRRLIQILALSNLNRVLVDVRSGCLGRADFGGNRSDRGRALAAGLRGELILRRLMEGSPRS